MTKPIVEIQNISKRYAGNVLAVDQANFTIEEGEFFALLGPSGCGKTTLLRMISGFEMASEGTILIDGRDVTYDPPNMRQTNMVFQSYAVFPHMRVRDNIDYGLKIEGLSKQERTQRVEEAINLVQLDKLADRMPDQLSGGQRQRVALARALVKRPKLLLLDEPLSALDAKLREAMQIELVKLQHTVGITFIMVTHDQDEALSMANRIAVMNAGQVLQIASPIELYEYPSNRFVADFIGKMNVFEGKFIKAYDKEIDLFIDGIGEVSLPLRPSETYHAGEEIGIAIRPEKATLHAQKPPQGRIAIEATVRQSAYYGNQSHIFLTTENGLELEINVPNSTRPANQQDHHPHTEVGTKCWFTWNPADTLILRD